MSKSKLLVALAIAASFATSAFAQSNVTIYGTVDASFQGANATGQDATKSRARVQSNESFIGFKGVEDLGNGTKALFQVESGVNLTGNDAGTTSVNNGTTFGKSRDSFAGLSGNAGTVLAGYLSTPYRSTLVGLDVFNRGDAQIDTIFGRTRVLGADVTSAFRSTAVAYALPSNAYGITGSVAYTGNGSNQNSAQQNGAGEGWSANAGWSNGVFGLVGAAQTNKFIDPTLGYDQLRSYLVGANYTGVPGLKVSTGINRNYVNANTGKIRSDSYFVGASYRTGKIEPRVSYVKTADAKGVAGLDGTGASQWNLGVGYHLSKRTEAYALYSRIDNGSAATYDFTNSPVATTTALVTNANVQTYGVGLRHSF